MPDDPKGENITGIKRTNPPGNSQQRKKAKKMEERITDNVLQRMQKNPMAKNSAIPDEKEKRRNRRGVGYTVLGLAAAFASWGYFVLAANPSFYFGLALAVVAALCSIGAVFEFSHSKAVRLILTILIVTGSYFAVKWATSEWKLKVTNDVVMHLDVSITIPSSGDLWKSVARARNNSSSSLLRHQILCGVERLRADPIDLGSMSFTHNWGGNQRLEIGGDSDSDACLDLPFTNRSSIQCAEVFITIDYTVDSWPEVKGQKSLRFVTHGGDWVQQPVNKGDNPCQ